MHKRMLVGGLSPKPRWRNAWISFSSKSGQAVRSNRLVQTVLSKKWTLLLAGMGFLLGRAVILDELSPFAIAYFAVLYFIRRETLPVAAAAILAGTLFAPGTSTLSVLLQMCVFWLAQKGLEKYERADLSLSPILVFASTLLVQVCGLAGSSALTWYGLMMAGVESLFSLVLTLIFIQALPVLTLTKKNYQLKHEEIICLIILFASVMTGTVGWHVQDVSVEHVLTRYFILLFALVGGAPLGASVGVMTGLILSLANVQAIMQMSLLAFAGLLAGLLKEGRKLGVAVGMMVGSLILSVYVGSQSEVMASLWESALAVLLLALTPRTMLATIAKYVPGTQENLKSQHDYARRVRDVTASRVEQFSNVFRQLSRSFTQMAAPDTEAGREEQVGHFMNHVAQRSCAGCWKRNQCWDAYFYRTYSYMTDMMSQIERNPELTRKDIPKAWKTACVKTDQVWDAMKQQYELYQHNQHWKRQIQDSRQLVSEQLTGVSQVMEDLAREIKREGQEMYIQEEQIRSALEELGLSIHSIDIVSLDEGNVEIEIMHQYTKGYDECRKIIAPLLSDIMGENIAVLREQAITQRGGYQLVVFGSAKAFEVETGIAGAAKGGDLLSGDSFTTVELGNGKFVVAISDGMGNGERAKAESSAALSILKQLLESGMDEKLAIKSVNSVLLLRSADEVFATVDLALIDLFSAQTTFMKIGSTPSFIKRGSEVIPVSAGNLPIGILQDIDVDLVGVQLKPGDVLIMMSDGIYDAPGHAVNKELWMKRIIHEIETEDPQEFADCLLERTIRSHHQQIMDDMTVVVSRITRYQPEWSTLRIPGLERMQRPKTVS